jgi:hypothetical protein
MCLLAAILWLGVTDHDTSIQPQANE